jgi:hypothetical protein
MMIEAWRKMRRLVFERLGSRADVNFALIEQQAGIDFDLLDTGTAGDVQVIRHGLGRVPAGMVVMNQEVGIGLGPVHWYRERGDEPWTERELQVRFSVTGAHVRLWIW